MKFSKQRLATLRQRIGEIDARDAAESLSAGRCVLIDVRESSEWSAGSPVGAVRLSRSYLELEIEKHISSLDEPVILMCAGGARSLFAGDDLCRMGATNVRSLRGGFKAWKEADLPVETPASLSDADAERYARHLIMPEIGVEGQARLLQGRVLLVGAGGLGAPAALYLAAAGVGTIGLADHDVVDRSNLQRQIIHSEATLGDLKVDSAKAKLRLLNPDISIQVHPEKVRAENVEALLSQYDMVIDGTDNFAARYLISAASLQLRMAHIYGAVYRFEGQVSTFWPAGQAGGPCYRCLFPHPPAADAAPNCAEAGVLGVVPGTIGLLQANEALKLILQLGEPLIGRILNYDALKSTFTELRLSRDPDCPGCAHSQ